MQLLTKVRRDASTDPSDPAPKAAASDEATPAQPRLRLRLPHVGPATSANMHRRRRNVRRGVALLAGLLVVPIGVSYTKALGAEGTDPVGARTVQWLRDHSLGSTVNQVEKWYYTLNAPPRGGTPKGGLPTVDVANADHASSGGLDLLNGQLASVLFPAPPNLKPFVDTPLPGEGEWRPSGRLVSGGLPAVYTAFMRPDGVHTSLVAGFMWMNTSLMKAVLIPGLREPSGAPQKYGAQIPNEMRGSAVVAFNSAFRLDDARGGYYDNGAMVRPLVDGQASLVIDKNGQADVVAWGRERGLDSTVATVRQNLALLVDNGVSAAGLDSEATMKWGATVGNQTLVWRSGVGVDAKGNLMYVAGPGLSINQLANLFLRAGAVRAMELDINSSWTTAYIYEQIDANNSAAIQGVKLLPDMTREGGRYLVPGERDFVVMLARF